MVIGIYINSYLATANWHYSSAFLFHSSKNFKISHEDTSRLAGKWPRLSLRDVEANYYTIDTGIHPAEFKINGGLFPRLYFEGAIKVTDPTGQPDFNNSISISVIRALSRDYY